jgi:hypothetical protein
MKTKLTLGEVNGVIDASATFEQLFGVGTAQGKPQALKVEQVCKQMDRDTLFKLVRAIGAVNVAAHKLKQIEVSVG